MSCADYQNGRHAQAARLLEVSGYNNTVTGVTVMGNGCGGVALWGGR